MAIMRRAAFQYFLVSALLFPSAAVLAAENAQLWQRFDESQDLQTLAGHDNDRMHFQLLQSRVLDKNELWQPFAAELEAFGEARYAALKPVILEASIPQLQAAVAAGQLTYAELTLFYIYRLREIESDPVRYLNAVISINPDALTMARDRDSQRQSIEVSEQSIFGMPVMLKDNIGFAGMPTTAGALALQGNHADSAFITRRLQDNGAIILGKANLSEWAYFFCQQCPSGYSAMGGQTLNPYGRFEFGTGGSSSGSGVVAAANLASVTVGSETSGSILSPASSNSVVGLKPTTGSLSRSGIVPISSTLDTAGPITRSVTDAVILFNAMAGFDGDDVAMPLISEDMQLVLRDVSLANRRLGSLTSFADDELYQAALSSLSVEGALVVETAIPDFNSDGFSNFLGAEMVIDLASYLESYAADSVQITSVDDVQEFNNLDPELRAPYGQALFDMMAAAEFEEAELVALRERLQNAAREAMDALFAANRIEVLLSMNNSNAGVAALANYPALTIPMGYNEAGRPVGLTLIAPSFQEQLLIDIGLQFERLSNARRAPQGYQ